MTIHLRDVEVDGRPTNVTVAKDIIVAVGSDVRPQNGDLVVDGGGGALLPGLHDHHIHLAALAAALSSTHTGPPGVQNRVDLANALTAADDAAAPDAWLRAVGYHETVAGELDRFALDQLIGRRPVRVQHRSGALWMLNTRALECLGLLEGAVPDGCEVGHDGTPTGRLWRLDRWLATKLDTPPPDFGAVGRLLLSFGVTSVTDMTPYDSPSDFAPMSAAVERGDLPQQVTITGAPDLDVEQVPSPLQIGPAKILLADHALPSLDDLTALMRRARRARRPIAVHCVTRESLVLTLAAFGDVGPIRGDRIEHGAVVPPEFYDMLRSSGITVVTQPNFVRERGDDYLTTVDREDLDDLWRCGSLLEAGIAVGAGTDAPFGQPDPWALIAAAVGRRTRAGALLGPGERVQPDRAVNLLLGDVATPGGPARRVQAGRPSDLCLLATPLAGLVEHLGSNPVRTVIRAGRLV